MKVFVVGSTGTFAKAIVSELIKHEQLELSVLVRTETLKSSDPNKTIILDRYKTHGVKLIEGDVMGDTIHELAEKMKGSDVILSLVHHPILRDGQLRLIDAAKRSGVNWFIPSEFGMSCADFGRGNPFGYDEKLDVQEALKSSGLNWTIVCTGSATDLHFNPSKPGPFVDMTHKMIRAPGSFDHKITQTPLRDVGGLLAQVLLHPDLAKNQYLYLGAETLTFNEIAQILEKHFGQPFEREIMDSESAKNDPLLSGVYTLFSGQVGIVWDMKDTWNMKYVPEYQLTTLDKFLKEHCPVV